MIKLKAKRNKRLRKKLKVGEYRQWTFSVHFEYTVNSNSDFPDDIVDGLYDIAESYRCYLWGFFGQGEAKMSFFNKGLLEDGVGCQQMMASYLLDCAEATNIRVSFEEAV